MFIKPKVLILDIELAPLEVHVWQLFDQNVGLNQIQQDWTVLSWAAKWQGKPQMFYQDVRSQRDKRDDSRILNKILELMDEADIIIGQNSRKFDTKKLNARFIINKIKKGHPPSSYRQVDTRELTKKTFSFTSNKLEYMTEQLCVKYKKLKHKSFPGHELWVECLKGNLKAWREMEKYNKHDVLATEELYEKLIAWSNPINHNVYHKMHDNICSCGSTKFIKNGYHYKSTGKVDRYKCKNCGKTHATSENYLSVKKRKGMFR